MVIHNIDCHLKDPIPIVEAGYFKIKQNLVSYPYKTKKVKALCFHDKSITKSKGTNYVRGTCMYSRGGGGTACSHFKDVGDNN